MELLERETALAALAAASADARDGRGRVAVVSGEPGIGKTSLVARFLDELGARARVLVGTCDDLTVPRPLGPIRDLAGAVSSPLAAALAAGAAPHEIQALLVRELERTPHPTVLVLEDVHWADSATVDTITVLGRRIGGLPALLVVTLRSGEVAPGHPLHGALGALRAGESVLVELGPLSRAAVGTLAGEAADDVYDATAGNPFYVGELLAARDRDELPPSVANAVAGRASRLDAGSRALLELVSVVPNRVSTALLDAVSPGWPQVAEEPERHGLLEVAPSFVRFRHELARHAILQGVAGARRRALHADILRALLAADADPAEIVHHAEAAGDEPVVATHVLVAARRAAALESNREAYRHYRRASQLAGDLPEPERAAILEELARTAYLSDRIDEAFVANERAIARYRRVDDAAGVGRCLRLLTRLHWYSGDGVAAHRAGREAIALLEPFGPSPELGRAYAMVSQLAMLSDSFAVAVELGERAIEIATAVGDRGTRAHALVNIGSVHVLRDPTDRALLLQAHEEAAAVGDAHEAVRALINISYTLVCWAEPGEARAFAERTIAFGRAHEVQGMTEYARCIVAWLDAREGRWEEAERAVRRVIDGVEAVPNLLARTIATEIAVRRGEPDARALLQETADRAARADELQRSLPLLELEVELALLVDEPQPVARIERLARQVADGSIGGWAAAHVAALAGLAGVECPRPSGPDGPFAALAVGDWQAAADAFGKIGWTYDRALVLTLLDGEAALTEALEIARGLGAEPLARRAVRRLRALGARVPTGPRETTRANAAGLTARQLEVLVLLAEGLTNAEIAGRLVVSQRTAEHHVAAVLAKLGAGTRIEAVRRASELRLVGAS